MIETVIEDEGWAGALDDIDALTQACARAAMTLEPALNAEIALLLCDDKAIQALNKRFRHKDTPTNVLAFPTGDQSGGSLGDIALARETCVREALTQNIALRDHAAHLIIHGMLHLIGYDHGDDDEARVMEGRESMILKTMGIADPYNGAQTGDRAQGQNGQRP